MGKKWKVYLPGDIFIEGGVRILQVLEIGSRMDQTVYRVRCLTCLAKGLMTHATINARIGIKRQTCSVCRSNNGVKHGQRPRYYGEVDITPPEWPVPPMLRHLPRGWEK